MSNPNVGVRAHGRVSEAKATSAGKPGVLGVRREDKNKWERRAPLAPHHVAQLVSQGIKVIVQPSTRRVYNDSEYQEAGAVIQEDLIECSVIAAVKEVPIDLLLPDRTWLFFSHTIKAQPAGMPLLDAILQKRVRLIDYECITETGKRGDTRLVAFGAYAGYAGAIDFLRGLGERFLALGFSTPLLHVGSAFMYPSLEEAQRAVTLAGDHIRHRGLPAALCPFIVTFTGKGNVSNGALDIFKLLPHEMVQPEDLPRLCSGESGYDCRKLYFTVATAEHMVKRRDGAPFSKANYYAEPDQYESIFQDTIVPYSTVVVNGMYWDARFPKLFTRDDLHRHVNSGHDRLLGVCDITCDADGSVPTSQFTSIEQPFYIYNALTDQLSDNLDEPGVLFHAVDHLPSELPREATEHFGSHLVPFLPDLLNGMPTQALPLPMRGAIVAENGQLAREYQYIQQLRLANNVEVATPMDDNSALATQGMALRPHGPQLSPPACVKLELSGHLFDTKLINQVCDLVENANARLQILNIEVGSTMTDESFVSILVMAHDDAKIASIVGQIDSVATKAGVVMRRAGVEGEPIKPSKAISSITSRSILVLGAGFVSAPLIEYLLRRPENVITVASLERKEVESMAMKYGQRIRPEILDVTSSDKDVQNSWNVLVQSADVIVSMIPATLHVGVARLAIQHNKHMVTASYVSEEMQSLNEEATAAGVLIINEVGLDPGIDHMSAMKMIDEATVGGRGKVVGFSSLCGGLPAPEAAGSSPLGYKFSWSPKGVLLASRNSARYRRDGQLHEVPGHMLLASAEPLTLNNALAFDVLPNRDSTAFAELYGLADAPSFFRGTLRYKGFCERMQAVACLGLVEPSKPECKGAACMRDWLATILGVPLGASEASLRSEVKKRLAAAGSGISPLIGLEFMSWLGLFSDAPLPAGVAADAPVDVLGKLLQREEMAYKPGERDMCVMRHELDVELRDGGREQRTATLVEYGEPGGHTSMSRTVGLTAAICAQLVLDGPERFGVGVQRPLRAEWYEPVLLQLEQEGIKMDEHIESLPSLMQDTGSAEAAPAFASRL